VVRLRTVGIFSICKMYSVNAYGYNTKWCEVCESDCPASKAGWKQHINGSRHQANLQARNRNDSYDPYDYGSGFSVKSANSSSVKVEDEVKIAVEDTSADIITFQESIGGKSAANDLAVTTDFENVTLDAEQLAAASCKEEVTLAYFRPKCASNGGFLKKKELALFNASSIDKHSGGALFGHLFPSLDDDALGDHHQVGEGVYLNTHEPFCFVTVGVQGAGKSHTTSCVLESCLVPFETCNIVKLSSPMTSLVLQYDHNPKSVCEAAGLLSPNPSFQAAMSHLEENVAAAVPKSKAVILVSPTYYAQRKKYYGDYCTVKPLLFRWSSLGADHIKRIMRIESGDNQLYVAVFLDLLREYQRKGKQILFRTLHASCTFSPRLPPSIFEWFIVSSYVA